MKHQAIEIRGVRNLGIVTLAGLGDVNLFYGENGAGKSSVLEAIYMLSLARSFRSTQLNPVIGYGQDSCTVFSRLVDTAGHSVTVGVQRQRRGGFRIKINGEVQQSVVALATLLPVQLINATSYLLLDAGPKQRRQFLDWGVFHVKHSFYRSWQKAQRCIKQRNAALRAGNPQQAAAWDQELLQSAELLDSARKEYFAAFKPVFERILAEISGLADVQIGYRRGWSDDTSLAQVLSDNLQRDRLRGLTHNGPHRADLRIMVNGLDAAQVLSRGQSKLVVCALRLAQTELMQRSTGKRCVLLVDDLPAEVDLEHQRLLCQQLDRLDSQLFITCIEPDHLSHLSWEHKGEPKLFHVKQGTVIAPGA